MVLQWYDLCLSNHLITKEIFLFQYSLVYVLLMVVIVNNQKSVLPAYSYIAA